ncbi:type II secretion system F family protein [Mycobacterium marinum]|uniref:type II secretion system F family protein n=1 Tax=Mycobacterium marinum TaxID=1781 RepID=UPI0019214FA0|nr:type II secretion system F family protein [Mycobacterium marinum]MDC8982126.1 type II secretion system F family protein [Mycobacterium marinum]MDC8998848.1 type II secretion system F family protein [Mycobacterium marinum]MDC9009645.1 type II secretion system F family protein [Mycobacterium marinum]QQW33212.1 type II secretion system F family protein [Mycobacterium marinum]
MTGLVLAALMVAAAIAVLSVPVRRRISVNDVRGHSNWLSATRWLGCLLACALAGAVLVMPLTTVLAVAVVAGTASRRRRRRLVRARGVREGRALEAALEILVGELRVGAHPVRAFGVAADETDGPVAAAMRGVAAHARLGADVTGGLRAAARQSALPSHWERLAVYWQLASDHGLAIATLMRAAQRDVAQRQRFSAKVSAGLAGARASAGILAGLPVLGVVLGQLIGAQPLAFLLGGHLGGWLLVVGLALAAGGLWWSDRITDRVMP